mmetsp:Transcript_8352/g.16237  ORF Transcript_8352/g.16237 Transcript_8352/m.16237 type:complete len:110 (-) Transcript_8352:46-375(-)
MNGRSAYQIESVTLQSTSPFWLLHVFCRGSADSEETPGSSGAFSLALLVSSAVAVREPLGDGDRDGGLGRGLRKNFGWQDRWKARPGIRQPKIGHSRSTDRLTTFLPIS